MQERILEILGHLLSYFQRDEESRSLEGISLWLRDDGYSTGEISEALSLFCTRFQVELERFPRKLRRSADVPMRIRNAIEREAVSGDAYAYLLQLSRLGLISADDLERIIERAIMLGGHSLGCGEIRSLAASVIFPADAGGARMVQRDSDGMVH